MLTALSLGGALVSFAMASDGDVAPTPSPDGSPPEASTVDVTHADATLPADTALDAFCKGTLGLFAPMYEECCDPSDAPKQYDECAEGLRCQLGVCGTAGPAVAALRLLAPSRARA